jgi:predicted RNA binding protein YcfA (HicA-like mRNA interferase family)
MNPLKLPDKKGPEYYVREAIVKFLQQRGWVVKKTHGSAYQSGFPDLYCTHVKHGPRWIEVKLPNMEGSRWTKAQQEEFPLLGNNGTKIWILVAATESEYKKLFGPDNWFEYFLMKD